MKKEQKIFFYHVNGGLARSGPLDFFTKESLPKERVWENKSSSIIFNFFLIFAPEKRNLIFGWKARENGKISSCNCKMNILPVFGLRSIDTQ